MSQFLDVDLASIEISTEEETIAVVQVAPDVFMPDVIEVAAGFAGPTGPAGPPGAAGATGPTGPNPMTGGGHITVGPVAPSNPVVNDVWVDTS